MNGKAQTQGCQELKCEFQDVFFYRTMINTRRIISRGIVIKTYYYRYPLFNLDD